MSRRRQIREGTAKAVFEGPHNMRLWDIRTSEKLGRDRFHEHLEKVAGGCQGVSRRRGIAAGRQADSKGSRTTQ